MIAVRDGAGLSDIGAVLIRDAVGLSDAEMWVRDVDGLSQVFGSSGPLAVSLDKTVAVGRRFARDDVSVPTEVVTATITGGVPPVTLSWAKTAGTSVWAVGSPGEAATRFTASLVPLGTTQIATFQLTAKDARGATAVSAEITASVSNEDISSL